MRTLFVDIRHALRLLGKAPGFALVAVLTLAVGIGINVAIFSVVSGVLLRPLPYHNPDELVLLWEGSPQFPEMSVAFPDFEDWRKMQHAFTDVAAMRRDGYTLTGLGAPERLRAAMASANFFRVLGVPPALGRDFTEAEDRPHAPPVVIVSDKFWRDRLGADPGALGRTLMLDGRAFSIIGVLPPTFKFEDDYALWVTMGHLSQMTRAARGSHPGIRGVGRRKPGVTVEQARADMETVGRQIHAAAVGKDNEGRALPALQAVLPKLAPLASMPVRDVRATLLVLLGAVAFVLLIACANVANLMLARGTARSRELAVRAALGASRFALMRPLLVESALLALVGGVLGVILALWGVDLLVALKPDAIPRTAVIRVDRVVLAYSLAVTTATALVCGLVPAIRAGQTDVHEALKAAGSRAVAGLAHGRLRATLVVAEVALALVVLVGAGLSLRTFRYLTRLDVGFTRENLLTTTLSMAPERYDNAAKVRSLIDEAQRRLAAVPGVESAALAGGLPFAGAPEQSFYVDDPKAERFAVLYMVTPGYFRTLRIPLLAGRDIAPSDGPNGEPVCIVDELIANTLLGGVQNAVGRHIGSGNYKNIRVIGVAGHVLHYGLEGRVPAHFQLYTPLAQFPEPFLPYIHELGVALRGPHAAQLIEPARTALAAYDPELPLSDVATMHKLIADSVGARKFAMLLFGAFAVVALLLAVVGLYAVMSYMVTQRNHEIGVRMALGARGADVQRMVVRQALRLVALGLVVGVGVSLALTRVMTSLVNGVSTTDPITYGAVGLVLALAATLASFVPARAATRVDPMVVLRYE
jgi:predicted permease